MKGIGIGLSIVICLGVFGAIGYMAFDIITGDVKETTQTEESTSTETQEQKVEELSRKKFAEGDEEDLNPFGDSKKQMDLTSSDYQEYIHQMSHQKVKADKKWGFYLITEERIDWLIEGLEVVNLKQKDRYSKILSTWQNGDFSAADDHHNEMWRLQGGTVGKAFGILSEAEEEAYIEKSRH
ncbi:DUF6241 domain-containing protein [Halobacillus massiliensis]|uniref:DUF6241 domain-containing protein n=1 Tax=Halobacillus massiliensis TaxID=1926286 RepID=UPI0009E3199E|nr:DUF6241 domain-containing protein [Halobacillus massiliensis]